MRVLFINHPEADFGEYFLYNGLCEVLGAENVIDYPFKLSYHGQVHTYPSCYRTDPGATAWQRWEAGETDVPMGHTSPYEFAAARPGREWKENEIADGVASGFFDITVIGSPRDRSIATCRHLLARGLRLPRPVLHDGEDYSEVSASLALAQEMSVRLVLKRELLQASNGEIRVLPFPFSATIDMEPLPKMTDIFCPLGATHPIRLAVQKALTGLGGVSIDTERRDWHGYIAALRASRIAIAPRGFGYDTVRRWEIPAVGTFLVAERLPLIEEQPLRDGEHCAFFTHPDQLPSLLTDWLARIDDLETTARQGQAFVRQFHTNSARARRLLEVIGEVYG